MQRPSTAVACRVRRGRRQVMHRQADCTVRLTPLIAPLTVEHNIHRAL